MASIVDVLDGLRAAIEAVAVSEPVGQDDTIRTFLPTGQMSRGSRATLVQCTAPSPILPGYTCSDYAVTVTLSTAYAVSAPEGDARSTYERALVDAEAVAVAIQAWGATADDILRVEQQQGELDDNGDGWLLVQRTVSVQYRRT